MLQLHDFNAIAIIHNKARAKPVYLSSNLPLFAALDYANYFAYLCGVMNIQRHKISSFFKTITNTDTATLCVTAFVIAIGVIWSVFFCYTVPIGDDLNYQDAFSDYTGIGHGFYNTDFDGITQYLSSHYENTNGRFSNVLFTFSINFIPLWLTAILAGMMTAVMTLLILYFAGLYPCRQHGTAAIGVAAFISIFFPWYDYFDILCVNYNYVWAVVFPLIVFVLLKRNVPMPRNILGATAIFGLCIIAGAFHEAAGLPLCGGLLFVCLTHRTLTERGIKELGHSRLAYLSAFVIGAIIVGVAPGIWDRIRNTPDAGPAILIAASAPFTLLMLVIFAIETLSHSGRQRLRRLFMSDKAVWPIAAMISLPIIAVGGIIGRSGFFSQTFALIAILQYWHPWTRHRVSRGTAAIIAIGLAAITLAQLIGLCIYNRQSYFADKELLERYATSNDGIVYLDRISDSDVPFWAWSRFRNLHIDDAFSAYAIQKYFKKENNLVLLPEKARNINLDSIDKTSTIHLSDNEIITGTRPDNMIMPDTSHWTKPTIGYTADGTKIVMPIPRQGQPDIYYIGPRVRLFGE